MKRTSAPARKHPQPAGPPQHSSRGQAARLAPPTHRRRSSRKLLAPVPAILLEGDESSAPAASGPGTKYALGATPPAQSFVGGELPASYGTGKLFLTAREPHWLYANWDLSQARQKEFNAASANGHLILRVYDGKIAGHPAYEIHVHPESRHWFAHVERAGNPYAAELGYYSDVGKWRRVAASNATLTPPEAPAADSAVEFATIPFEFPFAKLMQIVEDAARDNQPLAVAIEELRRHGHPDLPRVSTSQSASVAPGPARQPGPAPVQAGGQTGDGRVWTPEQEQALARMLNLDQTRRVGMSSWEITELLRRRQINEATSPVGAFAGQPSLPNASAGSSPGAGSAPGGPGGPPRNFWFNINAELVVYGATQPDAKVTLGGHPIQLRSDGSFSFRFALPDGSHELPVLAVAADGTDGRAAELKFSRTTEYLGDVGIPQPNPNLQPPPALPL